MNSDNKKYLASLESRLDLLETELFQLDLLVKKVGFSNGIITLKEAAEELLKEDGIIETFNNNLEE